MKKQKQLFSFAILSAALSCALSTAHATNVIKANNTDALNLGTSWVSGVPPTSSDVAIWDSTVTAANTVLLGANTNWAGIKILSPTGNVVISAGNVLTLGASGIDMSLATVNLTLNNSNVLGANQTWNVASGLTLTSSGGISGSAQLIKSGAGTLVLSTAPGTYTGGTVVSNGILQLNVATGAGGAITNYNGTTIRVNTTTSIANNFNANGTVTVDLNNQGGNQGMVGVWSGNGTVNFISQQNNTRIFTLGGGTSGNLDNFTGTINFGTNTGTLRFNDGGSSPNLGNANATFDLGTGSGTNYTRNRGVTVSMGALFGGVNTRIRHGTSASGNTTYVIGGKNIVCQFDGVIQDGGSGAFLNLTKAGTSIFTVTGQNTYGGVTTVSAGTLQVGTGGALGSLGSGAIINNATLVYNRSGGFSLPNAISGSGNLVKVDPDSITFNGTNSSSGTLVISNGTAIVGATGSILSPVSINAGAFFDVSVNPSFVLSSALSGNGSVVGALTATTGSSIRPGGNNIAGTLTFNNGLSIGGTILNIDLSDDATGTVKTNDLIAVQGDLTLNAASSFVINKLNSTLPAGTYKLITYTGNFNGSLSSLSTGNPYYTLSNPPGEIDLVVASTRAPASLTWVGDGGANNWDSVALNWLNGVTPDTFLSGDTVVFNNTGAANPVVNVTGILTPAQTFVNSTANYQFVGAGNIAGSGSLVKSNTGTLTIQTTNDYTGPTIIAGGVLEANTLVNGSLASSIGAAGSDPTNLVFYGSTLHLAGSSATTDRGATFNGAGAIFDIDSGRTLTLNGSYVGTGALIKNGVGTLQINTANGFSGGTVLSNGVLALGTDVANSSLSQSGLGATNAPVTFYGGTLQLFGYNGSTGPNYRTVYNPLIVPAGQTGTLRMFPRGPSNSGANSGLRSSLSGAGTLNLVVNYIRDNIDGDWSAFTGLINVTAKSGADEFRINNSFGYANASIYLNDGVNMCRADSANTINDIGELASSAATTIQSINLTGTNTTWRVGWKNTTATFAGTIGSDNSIIKVGSGTWNLSGQNSFTGSTTVSNGVLALIPGANGDGSIGGSSSISIVAGATLDVSTLSTPSLMLGGAQTLQGNGTLLGTVDLANGGHVSPGLPTGTLTVTGAANLGGGVTISRLNRNAIQKAGKLNAPQINLGGTLVVTNVGARFQVGDTFDLFDGTFSGSFSGNVVVPNYYTWNTSNLEVDGTISVASVLPGPSINSFSIVGTDVVLSSSNGWPNGGYTVLTSTNVALPVSSWTPVATGNFDGSGNASLNISINPDAAQQFYLIQGF